MTSRLFESITFEPDKLPKIQSDYTIFNYMPASAHPLGQADEWQGYLLYKGPANGVISGSSQLAGTVTASLQGQLEILIPPFATYMQIGVVASGVGTVGFGSGYTYEVEVNNPAGPSQTDSYTSLEASYIHWGPGGDNGYSVSNTTGSFVPGVVSYERAADIRIAAFCFVWYRRAAEL